SNGPTKRSFGNGVVACMFSHTITPTCRVSDQRNPRMRSESASETTLLPRRISRRLAYPRSNIRKLITAEMVLLHGVRVPGLYILALSRNTILLRPTSIAASPYIAPSTKSGSSKSLASPVAGKITKEHGDPFTPPNFVLAFEILRRIQSH